MEHGADPKDINRLEKDSEKIEASLTDSERLMPELRTLVYCQQRAVEKGYTEDFRAEENGLICGDGKIIYRPSQIQVVDFYRFEGITDPGDMSILYVIETDDGTRGTLVDAYGTYSDAAVSKIITEVESIAKKSTKPS